jgi:hypothetical protein
MLGKVGNVAPRVELFWRVVGEGGESLVATWNGLVLDVEPSDVPVPDEFMRRKGGYTLFGRSTKVLLSQLTTTFSFVSFFTR